jgi:hypothetical protein
MKVTRLETKVQFVVIQSARRDLRLVRRANRFSRGRSGAALFTANVASAADVAEVIEGRSSRTSPGSDPHHLPLQ